MTNSTAFVQTNLKPTVFVVDDDVSVRESLELLITLAGWRAELFASAEAFLAYPQTNAPKCLVIDATLPDIDGLDLQNRINVERPNTPIIFLTGQPDVRMSVQAIRAGAFDFFTKPYPDELLVPAIRGAIGRSQDILTEAAALASVRDRYDSLTNREREVMDLVASGLMNKQIASELGISEMTVKTHRGSLMRKMSARSLPDLVRLHAKLVA